MDSKTEVLVRISSPEFERLQACVFSRYPRSEWAAFVRFGWRESSHGLLLTLASVDGPQEGEMDGSVAHVRILEPYTLRIALLAERHPLAIGIVHSHPQDCEPFPSSIDDDMDGYYAKYFRDFAPERPYVSLIAARIDDLFVFSGRVFWNGIWHKVDRVLTEAESVVTRTWSNESLDEDPLGQRTARLTAAFGADASLRLRRSTVAVIGAGGTGSIAIEVLARAGVGRIVVVDPDYISESNLERVHGSRPQHVTENWSKVAIAREHVLAINPSCEVEAYIGSLPQKEIVDAVTIADVALGCTDQQHGRLSMSDLSLRYLVPSMDCGVMLEGAQGSITGQIVQLVRFLPSDACALCREMVSGNRIGQELMSEEEKQQRQAAAADAEARGEDPDPYWQGLPQLNTVGYLTGLAGALAAGYAIGWISRRFEPPFLRLQMNMVAPYFDVQDVVQEARSHCVCRRVRGWADQGQADALISTPHHWSAPTLLI